MNVQQQKQRLRASFVDFCHALGDTLPHGADMTDAQIQAQYERKLITWEQRTEMLYMCHRARKAAQAMFTMWAYLDTNIGRTPGEEAIARYVDDIITTYLTVEVTQVRGTTARPVNSIDVGVQPCAR